jgi:hypothetical protein
MMSVIIQIIIIYLLIRFYFDVRKDLQNTLRYM